MNPDSTKRQKKKERREAKAERKARNRVEEKKSRPNNILLTLLIFGLIAVIFGGVKAYDYFQKDASIESYLKANKDTYGAIALDDFSKVNLTAKKNAMKVELEITAKDEFADMYKEAYGGKEGKEQAEYLGAAYLTDIKPQTRAVKADVTSTITLNGEELQKEHLTYREAKKVLKKSEEEDED